MRPDVFSSLALSRHRFRLRALDPTSLPPFLGSTLRGAFGHAFKSAVCVMEHRDCGRCLVAECCAYPYLFETPAPPGLTLLRGQRQVPHPFVLIPPPGLPDENDVKAAGPLRGRPRGENPSRREACEESHTASTSTQHRRLAPGDELFFDLLLAGRAVECLPYVIYAAGEMARRGLGVERARFELAEVASFDERGVARTIYSGGARHMSATDHTTRSLDDFVRARLEQLPFAPALRLRFLTPTRIRVEGDLQTGLSFELLARNLLRRLSLLSAVHGCAPLDLDFRALIALAGRAETRAPALRWQDWERYSNRQRAKMKLGGFVGKVEYAGKAVRELLPLVVAGEILHVGAGTSFGLGRYEIQ